MIRNSNFSNVSFIFREMFGYPFFIVFEYYHGCPAFPAPGPKSLFEVIERSTI